MAKHQMKKNKDGNIDIFAYENGYHNGPVCEVCGKKFCHHCDPKCYEEECNHD